MSCSEKVPSFRIQKKNLTIKNPGSWKTHDREGIKLA